MSTFIAAYLFVGTSLSLYALGLRVSQRGLERRLIQLESLCAEPERGPKQPRWSATDWSEGTSR